MQKKHVCVFCGASQGNPAHQEAAYALGKLLAEKDCVLVYGGSNLGLMGKVACGARDSGGTVVSIIPSFFLNQGIPDPYSDERIEVGTMGERKEKMIEMCDVFIALPGGIGTLDEIGDILTLISLRRKEGKVILCNFDGFYEPLGAMLLRMKKEGYISQRWNAEPLLVREIEEIANIL